MAGGFAKGFTQISTSSAKDWKITDLDRLDERFVLLRDKPVLELNELDSSCFPFPLSLLLILPPREELDKDVVSQLPNGASHPARPSVLDFVPTDEEPDDLLRPYSSISGSDSGLRRGLDPEKDDILPLRARKS
jgi:hypothetical protein